MHEPELLDLVNQNDEIIGTIWRDDSEKLITERLGYIRAVEMFIVNTNNELWIPKRTADKRIAPNGLDFSVGGHVTSGETYIEAVLKEINEEINLTLQEEDLEYVATIGPDPNCYIRRLYIYRSDETPDFNPNDFVSASWIKPVKLLDLLDNGIPAKSSLRASVELIAGRVALQ